MSAMAMYLLFFAAWVLSWIGLHLRRGLAVTRKNSSR
jgi:hypothetical protein